MPIQALTRNDASHNSQPRVSQNRSARVISNPSTAHPKISQPRKTPTKRPSARACKEAKKISLVLSMSQILQKFIDVFPHAGESRQKRHERPGGQFHVKRPDLRPQRPVDGASKRFEVTPRSPFRVFARLALFSYMMPFDNPLQIVGADAPVGVKGDDQLKPIPNCFFASRAFANSEAKSWYFSSCSYVHKTTHITAAAIMCGWLAMVLLAVCFRHGF